MNERTNDYLTTPQHENYIGYWVPDKGICILIQLAKRAVHIINI